MEDIEYNTVTEFTVVILVTIEARWLNTWRVRMLSWQDRLYHTHRISMMLKYGILKDYHFQQ